jgi:hypothetical protein
LASHVRASLTAGELEWFEEALRDCAGGSRAQLLRRYTEASHRVGQRPTAVTLDPRLVPAGTPHGWPPHWTLEDVSRAAFLLVRADAAAFADDALACYEAGDAREQQSWARAAWLMPAPETFLPAMIDTCRTSILPLFESVACENPYPAAFFPERNFNQVVLKSLFNGVALSRIVALGRRLNPDLARMAADYAQERRAAGRAVPADIGLVTGGSQEQPR